MVIELPQTFIADLKALDELFRSARIRSSDAITIERYEPFLSTGFSGRVGEIIFIFLLLRGVRQLFHHIFYFTFLFYFWASSIIISNKKVKKKQTLQYSQ